MSDEIRSGSALSSGLDEHLRDVPRDAFRRLRIDPDLDAMRDPLTADVRMLAAGHARGTVGPRHDFALPFPYSCRS